MFDWPLAAWALLVLLAMSALTWLASLYKRDVSIVDSVWSLFFLGASLTWWLSPIANGPRASVALALVGLWALRLCGYLTWRNWGHPEDRRYQTIRARNQPRYELKSLVIVFALQALLAWWIALPILPVLKSAQPWGWLDSFGATVFITGFILETMADAQMARFKAQPKGSDAVLNTGLWRYSRHPNYFGESVVWWGFYLMALGAGAPIWLVTSPLLINFLLVKVSGVPMLEQDIAERRPSYRNYILSTSSFIPRRPRSLSP
jgi:steroid 5-alpha reductase family enzyme